jgi:hypothetical protein
VHAKSVDDAQRTSVAKGEVMIWDYVAYFFSGAFLVNAVPHFVSGVCGRPFPSPFSSPPGRGLSSPLVNALWGTLNVVIGYFLACHVGEFHVRNTQDMLIFGAGGLVMAIMLAYNFGKNFAGQQ